MQQCSDSVPPVIRTFIGRNGNEIEICYPGTWADLCRNYVNRLPQNVTTFQGGNHANRLVDVGSAVNPGVAAVLGGVSSGSDE